MGIGLSVAWEFTYVITFHGKIKYIWDVIYQSKWINGPLNRNGSFNNKDLVFRYENTDVTE